MLVWIESKRGISTETIRHQFMDLGWGSYWLLLYLDQKDVSDCSLV